MGWDVHERIQIVAELVGRKEEEQNSISNNKKSTKARA